MSLKLPIYWKCSDSWTILTHFDWFTKLLSSYFRSFFYVVKSRNFFLPFVTKKHKAVDSSLWNFVILTAWTCSDRAPRPSLTTQWPCQKFSDCPEKSSMIYSTMRQKWTSTSSLLIRYESKHMEIFLYSLAFHKINIFKDVLKCLKSLFLQWNKI